MIVYQRRKAAYSPIQRQKIAVKIVVVKEVNSSRKAHPNTHYFCVEKGDIEIYLLWLKEKTNHAIAIKWKRWMGWSAGWLKGNTSYDLFDQIPINYYDILVKHIYTCYRHRQELQRKLVPLGLAHLKLSLNLETGQNTIEPNKCETKLIDITLKE